MVPRSLLVDDLLSPCAKLLYMVLLDAAMTGIPVDEAALSWRIGGPVFGSMQQLRDEGWVTLAADTVLIHQRRPQVVENSVENTPQIVDNPVDKSVLIHNSRDRTRAQDNGIVVVGSSLPTRVNPTRTEDLSEKLPAVNSAPKKRKTRIDDTVIQTLIKECDVVLPDDKDMKDAAVISSRLIKRWMQEHHCTKDEAILALPDAIAERARLYRNRWPTMELTPFALAKHWHRIAQPKKQQPSVSDDVALARKMRDQGLL